MMKIDKNIAMPPSISRQNYPFDQMEVGDSFVVSDEAKFASARVSAYNRSYLKGDKFTTRRVLEGLRIWRIA
jgi:hypothetical protein